jgi:Probable Zinc-ribbon domain
MKSIIPLSPELQAQWHPTKNGDVDVAFIHSGSAKKFWWMCEKSHEWLTEVRTRATGHNCPVCSGNRVLAGFNDLASRYPDIAAEWHPTKNAPLTPDAVTFGSKHRIHWIGACGHEWHAQINGRSSNKTGCPVCAGQQILVGETDLASTHPLFAQEWDYEKNDKKPTELTSGVNYRFWWICPEGHSYNAYMQERKKGAGCYFCNKNKVLSGFNDLLTVNPEVCKTWDYEKNVKVDPSLMSPMATTKVWWNCELGHSYSLPVRTRLSYNGTNPCNYCNGSRILAGFNDLATTHPEIAAEWDSELNEKDLGTVSKGTMGKYWWKCKQYPHSFHARVGDKVKGNACGICARVVVLAGFNDLATTHPTYAAQWHPTKNGDITPEMVTSGNGKKVWWLCEKGHEWDRSPMARFGGKEISECRSCSSQTSKAELEIGDILEGWGENVIRGDRSLLGVKELDMYLPDRKIAIEYNGVYWHSEKFRGRKYHYEKWLACKEAGVQLIQVWEDDWKRDKSIILRGLQHKIGLNQGQRVFARQTQVVMLKTKQTLEFMNANHIQGFASGSHYVGLEDKKTGDVVACLILKTEGDRVLNIIRYATSATVIGGFTKLLSYASKNFEVDKFITFADHAISDGGLYENNGFTADKEIAPDYMYIVNMERKHKFGYRIKKFRNSPELLWEDGLTEKQLAELNGLHRVWDSGKTRWVKEVG